ncbi:MAG: S-methyl-5-thioribose-1-phosphate isomerase [Deltaproteobacteria bacterium]|nr:S-methyl-5-thioribose-1-phosphate isomerase [Deltaproteobacteria bacterium]
MFSPMRYTDGALELIDQLALPAEERWLRYDHEDGVGDAIRKMIVRGAPAIGCAAAYGVAIAARRLASSEGDDAGFERELGKVFEMLAATRPTAVNLFWAIDRCRKVLTGAVVEGREACAAKLEQTAIAIHREDQEMCLAMGRHGVELIAKGARILTHCNTGALATGGYGTALGVIRAAHERDPSIKVFANETRPYLQGSRLTAWELHREGIDVTVIPDSSAAFMIARGEIDCAIVGADRIAANGDVANKIGTYSVALACRAHRVPFYVVAPLSTIDLETASGSDIPIEERVGDEILRVGDTLIAPEGVGARYLAFDVTPAELVAAIVTDRGIVRPPFAEGLAGVCRMR